MEIKMIKGSYGIMLPEFFLNTKEDTIKNYNGEDSVVFIPDGIVNLGQMAFYINPRIQKVVLSSTVKFIRAQCFWNCLSLSEINFPEGFTTIGKEAFRNCPSLRAIRLPKRIKTIGDLAFEKTALSQILYEGTEAQWNKIKMTEEDRSRLNAIVQFLG